MSQFYARSPEGHHALDYHFPDLDSQLQLDGFIGAYRSLPGALTDDDLEKLTKPHTTRLDKINQLVVIAKRRDSDLANFVEALKKSDEKSGTKHHDLVAKLTETLEDNYNCRGSGVSGLTRSFSRISLNAGTDPNADVVSMIGNDFTKVCCVGCNGIISYTHSMIKPLPNAESEGPLHVRVNPGGYQHAFYTVAGVSSSADYRYEGAMTAEHTWFEGYRWRIVRCNRAGCNKHWGWWFRCKRCDEYVCTNHSEGRPKSFFGILRNAICILPTSV